MMISNGCPVKDGQEFILTAPLIWLNPFDSERYTVPAGFKSDGASIPKNLKFIYGERVSDPLSPINLAAYLHDLAFTNGGRAIKSDKLIYISKQENDRLFYRALIDLGVGKITASSLYSGVLIGSRYYWQRGNNDTK
jgi:hypothetical protein